MSESSAAAAHWFLKLLYRANLEFGKIEYSVPSDRIGLAAFATALEHIYFGSTKMRLQRQSLLVPGLDPEQSSFCQRVGMAVVGQDPCPVHPEQIRELHRFVSRVIVSKRIGRLLRGSQEWGDLVAQQAVLMKIILAYSQHKEEILKN